jgi:hypothetical protein
MNNPQAKTIGYWLQLNKKYKKQDVKWVPKENHTHFPKSKNYPPAKMIYNFYIFCGILVLMSENETNTAYVKKL